MLMNELCYLQETSSNTPEILENNLHQCRRIEAALSYFESLQKEQRGAVADAYSYLGELFPEAKLTSNIQGKFPINAPVTSGLSVLRHGLFHDELAKIESIELLENTYSCGMIFLARLFDANSHTSQEEKKRRSWHSLSSCMQELFGSAGLEIIFADACFQDASLNLLCRQRDSSLTIELQYDRQVMSNEEDTPYR